MHLIYRYNYQLIYIVKIRGSFFYMFFIRLLFYPLVICLFFGVTQAHATSEGFALWLEKFKVEALNEGISPDLFAEAFKDVRTKERIIELDRKQPEGKFTFEQYKKRVITKARIAQGQRLYKKHLPLLKEIEIQYGVQPQYVVALWGIETSYGNNTGGFGVIEALATLAYDGRRSDFFRAELMNAFRILQEGHIAPKNMKGSWAGAMGQNQFMPSSFNNFSVDGNNDGKKDIWTSLPDVFASSSNYLKKNGWKHGERWGRQVILPENFSSKWSGKQMRKSLKDWKHLGVKLPSGQPIPVLDMKAYIIQPDGAGGPAFLVYNNFDVIMRWNKSTYFATSVGLLANAIVAGSNS